jgi:hypothetical protein
MATFSQSQVSANYAWLEATTGYSNPPAARSSIPASARQSYVGPTAHYRVGSASTGGINRGRPLPKGGLPRPYQSTGNTWADRPNAGKTSAMPNPYGSQNTYPTRPQTIPQPPRVRPQLSPKPARGPVAAWNKAARAGGNATSAAAAAINNSLTGISPAQAVSALGLAGIAAGSVSNAYTQVQNTANQYSGSTSAAVATAYGANIPFGTGPASGPSNAWVAAPGAAPGAGAVATGAAAAGAGLAALSGWVDSGAAAGPAQAKVTGPYMGVLEYAWSGRTSGVSTKTVRSDFVIEYRHNPDQAGTSSENEWVAVWEGGEQGLLNSKHSTYEITPLSFNGGPLPSPETEQESPLNLSRPSTQSLLNPSSTRDTSNPPRTPAPARTTTPRRTTTAPTSPPLTLPSPQPIPPGILPENDPLAPPAPVENPTAPSNPPQADPTNVPNPTPTTPPSTTPQYTPQAPGDYTGTEITDTPTGPAEVAIPPGGMVEQPTGTTITTDKPLPERDDSWYIPPLLIGGGLAIGTAIASGLKVDDPTTPGKFTQAPKAPTPPRIDSPTDNPCKCNGPILSAINGQAANSAAIQSHLTRIEANQNNPLSGFGALQAGQAGILGFLQTMNTFLRKAWETTRIQKALDVLTWIAVMHNAAMLSRGVGETFLEIVGQGAQAVGIRDEEDNVIDVPSMVYNGIENGLRALLSDAVYEGTAEWWNKANRIITTASAVIWSVRSIGDASLDLLEWVGEHTGRIGNALKRWGVVGENAYPWMSERPRAVPRSRQWLNRVSGALETVEDRISVYGQATSTIIDVQQEGQETIENIGRFTDSIVNGIPDPWDDNVPVQTVHQQDKAESEAPDIDPADTQKG